MNFPSPMTPGSTPQYDREYRDYSATPSPRRDWTFDTPTTPIRPATRAAHGRAASYSQRSPFPPQPQPRPQPAVYSPHQWDSPRFTSDGVYAARVDVDVSPKYFSSSRRQSASFQAPPWADRRHSYFNVRASTPYGESDEDEILETKAGTYVLPAQSRCCTGQRPDNHHYGYHDGGRYTNAHGYQQTQTPPYYYPNGYDYPAYSGAATPGPERFTPRESPQNPRFQSRPPTSFNHSRHSSMATPKRPSTARPQSSHKSKAKPEEPVGPRKATEADAKVHRIPAGYALKNWDPDERPILLLGSVFDFNSLGKWIFDWTVWREGRGSPIADIAGELWLLLIQLNSKIKAAENVIGSVRKPESREMLEDFLESGERLLEKLRFLLKACEAPMLKAAKKRQSGLGKSSGVEFVHTLFGPDREGEKTDKFMQSIRLFILRFDANCDDIVRNPTR
ncbi:hypothetical protein ISF_02636 [Cordyceps fumosorosea ARSEF 2679]|uniref:Vegetative cell wall protein gp1 n=1 Tax=Cordyceps fumosorosea (strain ARSEF 2679) TaxID=1081104 RepID=A0A162JLD6_CORFA|nr:hypothetical protein ISF_02636 [Cordyceps fumosorosea ARSEF 2679]OAA70662.1 hypothetical protein ISF_02636 [Cordyceps fumosorosea ARSEF 2679]